MLVVEIDNARLAYEPLTKRHAPLLSDALIDPQVYAYITGPHPSCTDDLAAEFARISAGPPEHRRNEIWWNFAVRLRDGEFIGRVEATLHDRLAEVAYLFGSSYWGSGYATESLRWLHAKVRDSQHADALWATVNPNNLRSVQLLKRLEYQQVVKGWPPLASYEPGDCVYCKQISVK